LKRLLLAITVVALVAALMSPAAQAQGGWHWCWNDSFGFWDSCWWDDGGIDQASDQRSDAGDLTQAVNITTLP
jgi:hypothetical protein